jgi:hypothetical protein
MHSLNEKKRQKYIDAESYQNTLKNFDSAKIDYEEQLKSPEVHPGGHAAALLFSASDLWAVFQLRYTAGEDLEKLARSLDEVVEAFDIYVKKHRDTTERQNYPPFLMVDMIDTYIDFLHLVCVVIMLHREELLPVILGWIKGDEYDGVDAVIEELFNYYFPDRPSPDSWIWEQPYEKLLDVVDAPSPSDRPKLMRKYLKNWYSSMKGQAAFWGAHEKIKPDFSPYFGYWAMCAGAFTYLLGIDDSSYRDEEVYPEDMVDYARRLPRRPIKTEDGTEVLRVEGGQACPREGTWFSPAKQDSARYFKVGEVMQVFDRSEYGQTIWQWMPNN